MRVPVEIVIDGVIDPAIRLPAIPNVQCRHAKVVEERRIIRSIPQRPNSGVPAMPRLLSVFGVFRARNAHQVRSLPHRLLRLRIRDRLLYIIHKPLERMRSRSMQESASVGIGVHVHDSMFRQLFIVRLHPLRRSQ